MTFQTVFLIAVVAAFGTLFSVLMYAWITVNLHQMKRKPVSMVSTPARRPEPPKLAA